MKVTIEPYTGAYPSTTTVIGEVAPQFKTAEFDDPICPQAVGSGDPIIVALGFAVIVPIFIYGFFFT